MNDDEPYFEVFCVWRQKVLLVLLEQLLQISLRWDCHTDKKGIVKKVPLAFFGVISCLLVLQFCDKSLTSQSSNKRRGCMSASVGKQTPIKLTIFKCLQHSNFTFCNSIKAFALLEVS